MWLVLDCTDIYSAYCWVGTPHPWSPDVKHVKLQVQEPSLSLGRDAHSQSPDVQHVPHLRLQETKPSILLGRDPAALVSLVKPIGRSLSIYEESVK